MEYKTIPFTPSLQAGKNRSEQAAAQLQEIINNYSERGWEYLRLEVLSSYVQPSSGCFGLGGKDGYNLSIQILVFSRKS